MRIALAQVNATVGDLAGNSDLIVTWTRRAADQGAQLVVFPEMMLTGYPVEDLALRTSFVEASINTLHAMAERLAAEGLGGIAVVTGFLDRKTGHAAPGRAARRGPARRRRGALRRQDPGDLGQAPPAELRRLRRVPVLRARRRASGGAHAAADGGLVDFAIAICEDLWQDGGPVAACSAARAGLL